MSRSKAAVMVAAVLMMVAASVPAAGQLTSRPATGGESKPFVQAGREPNGTPVPRTPWGKADLSGLWNKRPYGGTNMAAGIQPLPFTSEGLKAYNDVWNHVDPTSRCILPGVPRVNNSPYPMQIVHLQDKVIMLYEYMHNFRVIYTDGRGHPKEYLPQLMGHSVGRWEGDTLVIDTVGLTDRTWLDDHGNRHSDAMKVTERWTRISADQLRYDATIEDPKFYTKPWTNGWIVPLANPAWELAEYACTDFNNALESGGLQPGPLDGSGRNGTAMPTPPVQPRDGGAGPGGGGGAAQPGRGGRGVN
jgi:hypothetical protein